MKDYHINVFFSEEDNCYVADIPDLRYCSALGPTPEKAVKEVVRAKKAWLKTALEQGKPVPKPKYRPAIYPLPKKKSG
jgi:predicted RNase H-like HicB family nuclease